MEAENKVVWIPTSEGWELALAERSEADSVTVITEDGAKVLISCVRWSN